MSLLNRRPKMAVEPRPDEELPRLLHHERPDLPLRPTIRDLIEDRGVHVLGELTLGPRPADLAFTLHSPDPDEYGLLLGGHYACAVCAGLYAITAPGLDWHRDKWPFLEQIQIRSQMNHLLAAGAWGTPMELRNHFRSEWGRHSWPGTQDQLDELLATLPGGDQ